MIDREQWLRDNRFKHTAHLLWKELQESKGHEEAILTQRLYDVIVTVALPAALTRFQEVFRRRMEQGEPIYVDVPDLEAWPEQEEVHTEYEEK